MNLTIANPVLVGYQEVDEEDGSPRFAQIRMAALIGEVGGIRPDTDNARTYERLLVPSQWAIDLLQWEQVGYEQIMAAVDIAVNMFGIREYSKKEEYI